jgi:hypothetical protein
MTHGKPCLSHRSPSGANAQGETMGPGGLFAADPAEYAKLLRNLFESALLRAELGARGREHAREFYSLDRAVRQLDEVFQCTAVRGAAATAATLAGAPCLAYGASDGGARLVWHPDACGLARHHVEYAMNLPQWGAHLFPMLASAVPGAVLDLAPAVSLFTLSSIAASSPHAVRPYLLLPEPRFAASVRRTLEVNGVSSPVTVAEGRRDSPTTATAVGEAEALEALRKLCRGDDVGIIVIDAPGARAGWLARLGDALGDARPVIVIEPCPGEGDEPDPAGIILSGALWPCGYECLHATRRGTLVRGAGNGRGATLLFLHPLAHRGLRQRLVAAARRWAASQRAARVAAWPARIVRGARRRVRAMIVAGRAGAAQFATTGPPDAVARWRSPSP